MTKENVTPSHAFERSSGQTGSAAVKRCHHQQVFHLFTADPFVFVLLGWPCAVQDMTRDHQTSQQTTGRTARYMKLQSKRNTLQGRFRPPLLALCIFVGACLGALKFSGLPVSSQPNQVRDGVSDYGLTRHSLCGDLPLAAIEKMIPSDMVYFQRRWQQSR